MCVVKVEKILEHLTEVYIKIPYGFGDIIEQVTFKYNHSILFKY